MSEPSGINGPTYRSPIPERVSVAEPWENGPPTLIAIVALVGAGIAVLAIGLLALGIVR